MKNEFKTLEERQAAKEIAYKRAGGKCEVCGKAGPLMDFTEYDHNGKLVYMLRTTNFYTVNPDDFVILCPACCHRYHQKYRDKRHLIPKQIQTELNFD